MSKKFKKQKKYYAIKKGKGVNNIIVNTWEECSKLVLGYNSTYKSFLSREAANNYLNGVVIATTPFVGLSIEEKGIEPSKSLEPINKPKPKKSKKANTRALTGIRIPKKLYEDFLKKCDEMEMSEEKVIENMIKEWLF